MKNILLSFVSRLLVPAAAMAALPSCVSTYSDPDSYGPVDNSPPPRYFGSRYAFSDTPYYGRPYYYSRPRYGSSYYRSDHCPDHDHDHDHGKKKSKDRDNDRIRLLSGSDGEHGTRPKGWHSREWFEKRGYNIKAYKHQHEDGEIHKPKKKRH